MNKIGNDQTDVDIDKDVFELTDMEVHEVSLVDRAANLRRFLIVKEDNSMQEVVRDEQGELIIHDNPAKDESKDICVAKSIAAQLQEMADLIKSGEGLSAEEVDELKEAYVNLGKVFATEEDESPGVVEVEEPLVVEKAGRKLSAQTENQIRRSVESLLSLIDRAVDAPLPKSEESVVKDDGIAQELAAVRAQLQEKEALLDSKEKVITSQKEAIASLRKNSQIGASQLISEGGAATQSGVSWPYDLADLVKGS